MAQQNWIVTTFELTDPKRIQKGKQLGAGMFGPVWKATLLPANHEEKEEMVAIRVLNVSESDRKACVAEVRTMTLHVHENVVRIKGISFGGVDGEPQLIMELCNGGSLNKLVENDKLTEGLKVQALLEVAKGVAFLHKRGIIHRNIGSKSCFAHKKGDRVTFKIGNYGFASLVPDHFVMAMKMRLPVFSMSPEAFRTREWSTASDVWAFGILIMELFNKGRNPYEQYFDEKNVIRFLNAGHRVDMAGLPSELKKIVEKCTQRDNRPGMDEIVGMLIDYYEKNFQKTSTSSTSSSDDE